MNRPQMVPSSVDAVLKTRFLFSCILVFFANFRLRHSGGGRLRPVLRGSVPQAVYSIGRKKRRL